MYAVIGIDVHEDHSAEVYTLDCGYDDIRVAESQRIKLIEFYKYDPQNIQVIHYTP